MTRGRWEDAGLEAAAADGELGAGAHPRVLHEDLAPEAGPRHPRAGDQRVGHKGNFSFNGIALFAAVKNFILLTSARCLLLIASLSSFPSKEVIIKASAVKNDPNKNIY